MINADRPSAALGQSLQSTSRVSLLVVGGGVMGLWAALKASRLGVDVTLIEARTIGSGASGGLLGALMPYMPDKWDDKKRFQLSSLLAIESEVKRLEEETGLSAGYRRSGRLIPLPKPHLRTIAERHEQDALQNWRIGDQQFYWRVEDHDETRHSISNEFCESGLIVDTLAARIAPRAYVQVLRRALELSDRVQIIEGTGLKSVDQAQGLAHLTDGTTIAFGHVIVSAGYEAFPLLAQALDRQSGPALGTPIKGQSALLKAEIDPTSPVVFLNGIYVIPHEDGTVAVGSTSENEFAEPFTTDAQLDALLEKAAIIHPELRSADVLERWAGLRPRAIGREPMIGSVEEAPNIIALAGGFKITFGLAHHLADAALASIEGKKPNVPDRFLLGHHLSIAEREQD